MDEMNVVGNLEFSSSDPQFDLSIESNEYAFLKIYSDYLSEFATDFSQWFAAQISRTDLSSKIIDDKSREKMRKGIESHFLALLLSHYDEGRKKEIFQISAFHRTLDLSLNNIVLAYNLFFEYFDRIVDQMESSTVSRSFLKKILRKRLLLDMNWHLEGLFLESESIRAGRIFYEALFEVNHLYVEMANQEEGSFFSRLTELLVQKLNLGLAYVAFESPNDHALRIEAISGSKADYALSLRLSMDPTRPEGKGPEVISIRSGKTDVVDILQDDRYHQPDYANWRQSLFLHGLGGIAAIPFLSSTGRKGTLALYRKVGENFPEGIIQLFNRMSKDITQFLDHRRNAEDLKNISALYRALMTEGDILLTARNEKDLFQKTCDKLLESGLFSVSWIGLPDDQGCFQFQSVAGTGIQTLLDLNLSVTDSRLGLSVAAKVFRSGKLKIQNKLLEDQDLSPWWDKILHYGWRSSATFPIRRNGRTWGVLSVISPKEEIFTDEVIRLLVRIALLIGRGLGELDLRNQLVQEKNRHQHLSLHDPLTGLPNRLYFEQSATGALEQTKREKKHLAIAILDLDGFKEWNDTLGHREGDRLLQTLAHCLRRAMRTGEGLSRLGGDEFGMYFVVENREQTGVISQRILEAVSRTDPGNRISGSLGWAISPWDGEDYDSLLSHADEAMYLAKREGKNVSKIFHQDVKSSLMDKKSLEQKIEKALKRGDFIFYLQPQADCLGKKLTGVEMLVRWKNGTEILPPKEFISVIEQNPTLIRLLGIQALHQAIRLRKRLKEQNLFLEISFNIGARNFLNPDFLNDIESVLENADGEGLTIEITETAVLEDISRSLEIMKRLKEKKFLISVDDFGTGYSSLRYVSMLPFDILKLDQSFIQELRTNPNSFAVTSSAIVLSHLSGKTIIAEGIEFSEDLSVWLKMGGSNIQGYLLSRPIPEDDFFTQIKILEESLPDDPDKAVETDDLALLCCTIHSDSEKPDCSPILQYEENHCPLCQWFKSRSSRYGVLKDFEDARVLHTRLHRSEKQIQWEIMQDHHKTMKSLMELLNNSKNHP